MRIGSILLSAAFGGIFPNLFSLAVSLTRGEPLPAWTYLIGLSIFAGMGAGVAVIWKETDLKRAFYLGIGLPAFIQAGVGSVSDQRHAMGYVDRTSRYAFISAAHAASGPVHIEGRRLRILPSEGTTPPYQIVFSSRDGTTREVREVSESGERTLNVPVFAESVTAQKGSSRSNEASLPLQPNQDTTIRIVISPSIWSGFQQSIGIRNAPSYEINIRTVP